MASRGRGGFAGSGRLRGVESGFRFWDRVPGGWHAGRALKPLGGQFSGFSLSPESISSARSGSRTSPDLIACHITRRLEFHPVLRRGRRSCGTSRRPNGVTAHSRGTLRGMGSPEPPTSASLFLEGGLTGLASEVSSQGRAKSRLTQRKNRIGWSKADPRSAAQLSTGVDKGSPLILGIRRRKCRKRAKESV